MTEKEKLILSLLVEKPMTKKELSDALDRSISFIFFALKELQNKIHVVEWRKAHNNCVPVYAAGNAPDAPKPRDVFAKNHWLSRDGMPTIIRNNNCPVDFKRTEIDEWLFRARAAA